MSGEGSYPFYQRIVFSSYALTEYFVKCVIPVKLSYIYLYPNLAGEAIPLHFWIYPVLIPVVFAVFISRFNIRKHRHAYFLLLFFIANLAVTLHVISLPRFAIIADRYVYISSISVFLSIAMLFRYATQRYPGFKRLLFTGLAIYVLFTGLYSHERSKVWHDTDSLKKEIRELIEQKKLIRICKIIGFVGFLRPKAIRALVSMLTFGLQLLTFGLQRSTFGLQRSTFSLQRSTFGLQRSTFSLQRSTFSLQRSTFGLQLFSISYRAHTDAPRRIFQPPVPQPRPYYVPTQ
jgi:hypothetical protein